MVFKFSVIFFLALSFPSDVLAAAAVQRRQQQLVQQQMMQKQAYQQAVAQRQAQEVAVYQQAVAQRQMMAQRQVAVQQAAYQKAAIENAAYKQAMQQALAKRNAEMQAVAQVKQVVAQRQAQQAAAVAQKQMAEVVAYKRAVETKKAVVQKTQAEVNDQVREYAKYLGARKTAMAQNAAAVQQAVVGQQLLQGAARQKAEVEVAQAVMGRKLAAEMMGAGAGRAAAAMQAEQARQEAMAYDGPADTVVDIKDLWKALDNSSLSWAQIVDREVKLLTVSEYIDRFRNLKIKINKPPGHYAGLIDALGEQMEGFLGAPFMNVLSYAAIMEYDFDNGTDKDELARGVLGQEQFESNRSRVFGR